MNNEGNLKAMQDHEIHKDNNQIDALIKEAQMLLIRAEEKPQSPEKWVKAEEKYLELLVFFLPSTNPIHRPEQVNHLSSGMINPALTAQIHPSIKAHVFHALGWISYHLNKLPFSFDFFQESLKIIEENPILHSHLSLYFLKTNDIIMARRHFARALFLEPNNELIRFIGEQLFRHNQSQMYTPLLETPQLFGFPLQTTESRKSIVMGLSINYGIDKIKPFVLSLRKHYEGNAVFFVDPQPQVLAFLNSNQIETVVIDPNTIKTNVVFKRYGLYLKYLLEHQNRFDQVLISDTGDVIFQDHPFKMSSFHRSLYFFEEDESFTILSQGNNRDWMTQAFGPVTAAALNPCSVVNGGTILGSLPGVVQYLKCIISLFDLSSQACLNTFGNDQSHCQYIAHFKVVNDSVIQKNYGHVATLGLTERSRIRLIKNQIFVDKKPLSPIVHQYNYHDDLALWAKDHFK